MTRSIRLGLIGDNITRSQAPRLHQLAGLQSGCRVSYERLVPAELGKGFDQLFAEVAASGYRGVNITYPYKERAAAKVTIPDPLTRAMGAVNTVIFEKDGLYGFNTDHSGFIRAYRQARGEMAPGTVLILGAGGVGKAIGFALVALGVARMRIADLDIDKAKALRDALKLARPGLSIEVATGGDEVSWPVDGVINCTPRGMDRHPGSPISKDLLRGAVWAFDAVYTPIDTVFLQDARMQGVETITGYELFIGQGVDAWEIFAGLPLDEKRLRADLLRGE
ncbi:shikimate dehydrogenase family protein [Peteryoungia desertarenae]|uniref:shikimate dehydrogenase family protein n=1 Tax=Peteryoungia desertarenae TaxID=1813451 RepID=UPI001FE570D5|nr:shikimate dehydrogenase [Peteryoungia desertarenae]